MLPVVQGNCASIPGFFNAHSHAFQRAIRGRTEHPSTAAADSFWTWREAMYRAANRLQPEDVYAVSRMAFMEMLLAGITTVCEFHYLHHAPDGTSYADPNLLAHEVIRAANDAGIRIVLMRTAYERAGWRKPENPLQRRFLFRSVDSFLAETEDLIASAGVPLGIALHSVRALRLESIQAITAFARSRTLPIHMHVAEQPAEIEQCLAEHRTRPIELLQQHGILGTDFTAVHAIHITPREAGYLGAVHASVCACPTTERNLGDGPVPADVLLQAGANLCFGTDSNAQIDLLEDARSLEYHLRMKHLQRAVLPIDALRRGLIPDERNGDRVTIDLSDPSLAGNANADLMEQLVFAADKRAIKEVSIGGKVVVSNGRHVRQDEIVEAFENVQLRLWR